MNWDSITIEQGQRIIEANSLEPLERDIRILSILYRKPEGWFESKPKRTLLAWVAKTKWIEQLPSGKQPNPFSRGNHVYKFKTQPDQLNAEEFKMLQHYGQTGVENLHWIVAILTNKYRVFPSRFCDNTNIAERAEYLKTRMSFGMAYAYMLFFSTYYPSLLRVGQAYLQGVEKAVKESSPS